MKVLIITIYNSLLYYCYLLLIARYILNYTPRKHIFVFSVIAFIPFVFPFCFTNDTMLALCNLVFIILQFFALRASFFKIKTRLIVFAYIFLYCVNALLTSIVTAFIPWQSFYVDIVINTITVSLCAFLCLTKIRHQIHRIICWTPPKILFVSAFLLILATLTSVTITSFQFSQFPEFWNKWLPIFSSLLLMAICIIVPIIFIISISNTQLKTLTADYEQQIHAQAEHYKNLAQANYEVRRFRHDFKNIRIAIENLLERGEYHQALTLIRQCSDCLENPGGFHCVFDTGNGIADALLTDKQEKALAYNTQIVFKGAIPTDSLSPTDLCVILGNSLDNALEACQKLPSQDRKTISVSCNCSSGFLFLSITNPIGEKVIIRNNQIATTKENKTLHGFGLYSLHTIVKKYDGEIQLSATEDSFTVSIDLSVSGRT